MPMNRQQYLILLKTTAMLLKVLINSEKSKKYSKLLTNAQVLDALAIHISLYQV
jgi:hypothetical protein